MLEKPFKIVIGVSVLVLSVTAVMPFLGYNFFLYELKIVKTEEIPLGLTHLLVVRSACFAALAFFGMQYLRRKRPAANAMNRRNLFIFPTPELSIFQQHTVTNEVFQSEISSGGPLLDS